MSEHQPLFIPDNPRNRLTHPAIYGGMDANHYTPLLHTAPRLGSARPNLTFTTVFLFSLIVLVILNCFLTIHAVSYAYQTLFTPGARLSALAPADKLMECKTWTPPSIPGIAEFNVPIDERSLIVFARGSSSSGIARVRESPDVKDLKVSVSVHYRDGEALSGARVCLVEREDGGHGVAILTPSTWIQQKEKLFFVVNVTFPSPTYGVSHLPGFTIDVPRFALEIDDLSAFNFDAFTLKSTNSPISVKAIAGQDVIVEGKNSKISGSFNATRLLTLSTSNDAIEASAHLHNAQPDQPTTISLKTTNGGALHSNITLSSKGNFTVSAQTTNAPLDIALSSSSARGPVRLRLDAATHNAPAHVVLPPAFEGRFLLRTTRFRPELRRTSTRTRRLSTSTATGHAVFGNVLRERGEGEGDADAGWASVSTSNAPATLVL